MKSDFVVCQPFGNGERLYLAKSGEMLPDLRCARHFESFNAAREYWQLGGPSATIRDLAARRGQLPMVH